MVGDFSIKPPYYDETTHRLVLKEEYIGTGEIWKNAGNILIMFDTESCDVEEYPYYWASGLYEIFNIVPI
jgi:hypothetical protein